MRRLFISALACAVAFTASSVLAEERELTDDEWDQVYEFVFNNAMHTGFHEMGHMLIAELGIPVLGREEDAVDNLASVIILETDDEDLAWAIQDAADAWFLLDDQYGEELTEDDLLDTHTLDAQRAYNAVCMMVGADPEFFGEFADDVDFPEERREECLEEYDLARDSWFKLLEPHKPAEGAPATKYVISYETPEEGYEDIAELLKDWEFWETIVETVGTMAAVDDGVKLTARNCDEDNAWWDPEEREVVFCYEIAEMHAEILIDYFLDEGDDGDEDEADGGDEG